MGGQKQGPKEVQKVSRWVLFGSRRVRTGPRRVRMGTGRRGGNRSSVIGGRSSVEKRGTMRDECGTLECGIGAGNQQLTTGNSRMRNGESALATHPQMTTSAQVVKERGRWCGPGGIALRIYGGAACPVHFSRSAAQRKSGFYAVGGVICENGNSFARAARPRKGRNGK